MGGWISMVLYGMILSVLLEQIQGDYPGFIHSGYADYFRMAGARPHLKTTISYIEALGT